MHKDAITSMEGIAVDLESSGLQAMISATAKVSGQPDFVVSHM
jgi:hypothetical protein